MKEYVFDRKSCKFEGSHLICPICHKKIPYALTRDERGNEYVYCDAYPDLESRGGHHSIIKIVLEE